MHNEPADQFRQAAQTFRELVKHRAIPGFPELAPVAREIDALLGSLDLLHLHAIPIRTLAELTDLTAQAADHVRFMIDSHPPEEAFDERGRGRPQVLERNKANINSRRGHLEKLHREIFHTASPIIAHQQTRLVRIAAAAEIKLDGARSIGADRNEEVIWRYMPLRNLYRCERVGALWLSSLERLRTWSTGGAIPDDREGEIPPVVERLKNEFSAATAIGATALDGLGKKLGLTPDEMEQLGQSLDFKFELTNVFVSSWCHRKSESSGLWPSYADGGNGVALKSTIGKLLAATLRAPLDLFGPTRRNKITSLILRDVQYLGFDEYDSLPSINDLHLPLLKRDTFDDEHEVRLLAFTKEGIAAQGFPLYCNLTEVITEIVVGPNADFHNTVVAIRTGAPDLREVAITQSKLAAVAGS